MPVLPYKITSIGKLIDDALEAVEENLNGAERHRLPQRAARRVRAGARINLKNVLTKNYTQLQIDPANLVGLIDLIVTIPFQHADPHAKDMKGAQASRLSLPSQTARMAVPPSFTPKSIVSLIVEMIEPYQRRVYDPAMGSGGFFVGDTDKAGCASRNDAAQALGELSSPGASSRSTVAPSATSWSSGRTNGRGAPI